MSAGYKFGSVFYFLILLANSNCIFICSLPAKLSKGMDHPTYGSCHHCPYKSKGWSFKWHEFISISPFRIIKPKQGSGGKHYAISFHRRSLRCRELSLISKRSPYLTKYDETDTGSGLLKESNSSKVLTNKSQFHL